MDKTGYLRQIDKFYRKQLSANQVIQLGITPEYLIRLRVEPLPIVIKQVCEPEKHQMKHFPLMNSVINAAGF